MKKKLLTAILVMSTYAATCTGGEQPKSMQEFVSVIGYEVLTAPAKGTGFLKVGDVIHLKAVDRTFAAIFVERGRDVVAYSLGKLESAYGQKYVVARLDETHVFLTWDSEEQRFHIAESFYGPDLKEAANGGGSDRGDP